LSSASSLNPGNDFKHRNIHILSRKLTRQSQLPYVIFLQRNLKSTESFLREEDIRKLDGCIPVATRVPSDLLREAKSATLQVLNLFLKGFEPSPRCLGMFWRGPLAPACLVIPRRARHAVRRISYGARGQGRRKRCGHVPWAERGGRRPGLSGVIPTLLSCLSSD
jgi:hypothetical protein